MYAYYNPLDKQCKSVIGAVPKSANCVLRVFTDAKDCSLMISKDGDKPSSFNMKRIKNGFEISIKPQNLGLYYYAFDLGDGNFIGLGKDYTGVIMDKPNFFQMLVFDENFTTPDFIKGGIIYQIFPDRFAISGEVKKLKNRVYHENLNDDPIFTPNAKGKILNNDFFGGNLKGITEKLEYLKSLSVSVIYLNPIFKSYSNHHYDTGDYMCIDPNLGDEGDLKALIDKADKFGIKIILDGVFSHTGDDSRYFNKYGRYDDIGAYQSKESPYYSWYNFEKFPNKYASWWGIDILPEVNEKNPAYNDFINGTGGVVEHYTELGIGGWRLDVADELPTAFLKNLRKAVKGKNPQAIVIGEVWEDATNKISYGERRSYFYGNQLDSIMNYVLKDAIVDYVKNGNLKRLSYSVKEQVDHYPTEALHANMNLLATHDTYRLISSLGDKNVDGKSRLIMSQAHLSDNEYATAENREKMATLLQYTLCGVPSIYYGDELGMEGYSDPLCRRFFGTGKTSNDLPDWYKKLGEIRTKIPVFKDGEFNEIYARNGAYVYNRTDGENTVFVGVNNGDGTIYINFDGTLYDLLSCRSFENICELKPSEYVLLYDQKVL